MNKTITKDDLPEQFRDCLDFELLNREDQKEAYHLCLQFLEGVEKTNGLNHKHTSYGYKHHVEGRPHRGYVYEGIFILAAIAAGFQVVQLHRGCLASILNISQRGLRKKLREWSPGYRAEAVDL
jgi:hypothetical protein